MAVQHLSFRKFLWMELIGFDNRQGDYGVGEFLSRMEIKPEVISILIWNTDLIHSHNGLGEDAPIGLKHCAYQARPRNEEHEIQNWTRFQLRGLISELHHHGVKVYVTVNGEVEEYDKIIVTSPLYVPMKENRSDGLVGMVDYFDAREDEKKLFCQIEYERYDVLAVETKPEDHPEISYYVFDNMIPKRLGHLMVYYRRWRDTVDQVITTYALRKYKRMEEVPYEQCRARVLRDLETMGNPASNVVNEWSVYYFPHVFTNAYKDGWYDKVEAMQGKYDTYYAGEIMSFGDMDETCEYSRELVERFF